MALNPRQAAASHSASLATNGRRAVQCGLALLIAWGVARAVQQASADVRGSEFSLRELHFGWLALAGAFYAAGQLPLIAYWTSLLGAMGIDSPMRRTAPVFVYSHLGKYLPGKFMVVLMRSGLLGLQPHQAIAAATTVFIETLTHMAAGSFAASMGVFLLYRDERMLQIAAVTMMLLMATATWPPVIRWSLGLARRMGLPMPYDIHQSVGIGLVAKGWLASLIAWSMNTASLCAVLRAMPWNSAADFDSLFFFRALTATTAAVVAGFASMVPAGLFAREYVLDRLLVPFVGEAPALFAAVVLRLTWISTELIGSFCAYLATRGKDPANKHPRS